MPATGEVVPLFIARLPATFWPKFAFETESEITGEAPRVHFSVKLVFPVRPLVALATTGSYALKLRSPTALIWQFAATDAVALKFLLMAVACAGALARSRTATMAAARIRTDVRGMTTSSYAGSRSSPWHRRYPYKCCRRRRPDPRSRRRPC